MIYIKEDISKKSVGETSLFISFPFNQEILNIIKKCDIPIFDKKTKIWEVPVTSLSYLLDNLNSLDDITLDFYNQVSTEITRTIKLPKFKTKPFNYQLEGIQYGLTHDRWLLLDAPGLGKSLQIIYIAETLKKQGKIRNCLIICGINTLKTNWKKEITIHGTEQSRILGERIRKNGKLVFGGLKERIEDLKNPINEFFTITNIETLRSDEIVKLINTGINQFDMIVLDEAHCAKNPSSNQGKNFLKLNKAKYKIAATGTVLTNTPIDAYVPLKWIGKEKCSYSTFKYYFTKYGGFFNNEVIGYKNIDILKDTLDSCSLRRTKDLLELPPKTLIDEYVDMNDSQALLYKNIVDGVVNQVDKVNITTTSLLAIMARLRQATACPSILTTENIDSSKIERCADLVNQIISNGEKVVVYSTFKETLNVLQKELNVNSSLLCTGDIKDDIISENVDKFQNDPKCNIMLATWSKMGTGITLTAANNVIFIDTPYTQAGVQQAIDRCHRIGSSKPLFVYFLICKDTVDERIKEIVDDKGLISDYIVDDIIQPQLVERLKSIILNIS